MSEFECHSQLEPTNIALLAAEERLRLQEQVIEHVANGKSLTKILDRLCQLVEAEIDQSVCAILQFDCEYKALKLASFPGATPMLRAEFENVDAELAANSIGIAALENQTVLVADLLKDDCGVALRQLAAQHQFRAFWSQPIRINQQVEGCFTILSRDAILPTSSQKSLLETAANLAGIACKYDRHDRLLAQMLVRAESANHAKNEFLANMSHEIRTPLTAISGYADLLSMPDQRSDQDVNWARQIQRSSRHLGMLLDDILELARIESGPATIDRRPVELAALLNEVTEMFRPQVAEMLLKFSVVIDPALPHQILADATRFRQILTNLISNAVKFTEHGSVTVSLRRICDFPRQDKLQICVSDTGIGMSNEKINQLFQPFQRVHDQKRAIPGTGLGLAISKRLVEIIGGKIEVTSQLGVGTQFLLTFPLELVGAAVTKSSNESSQSVPNAKLLETRCDAELNGRHVLLAEDNPVNVAILTQFLKPLKLQLTVVGNGREALRAVLERRGTPEAFEVIVMDMQMPVMTGYEATEKLRENGVLTPIIACSAFAMASDKERCRKAGCNLIVSKPINRQILIAAILEQCPKRTENQKAQERTTPTASNHASTSTASDGFAALVNRYRISLEKHLTTIENAEIRNDGEEICTIAHRLSGTAGNYGFPEITRVAKRCEVKLRQGNQLHQIQPDLTQLKQLIAGVVAER